MDTKESRITLTINLRFLEENYKTIKTLLPEEVKVLCVIKANAYGHGAVEIAKRLDFLDVEYFGVATIDEGLELREHGIKKPILVMSGILPWDNVLPFCEFHLTPVIYDLDTLNRLTDVDKELNYPLNVHLKFDTGMGRLGFLMDDCPKIIEALKRLKNINMEGIMTHFSSSEVRDEYGLGQIKKFNEIIKFFKDHKIEPKYTHMANSGGIINYPEAYFNMVRLGIGLYGSYPDTSLKDRIRLKQVMRLTSKIALIREFPEGSFLSYGRTYKTEKYTRIAYVPMGYSDGYPRALSNRGYVLIRDKRCSIVGRICMDWILVDITDCPEARVGDEVVFLGYGTKDCITADEIAHLEGSIPYEVLCRLSKKIKRCYID